MNEQTDETREAANVRPAVEAALRAMGDLARTLHLAGHADLVPKAQKARVPLLALRKELAERELGGAA
jgi:hypothetical protein